MEYRVELRTVNRPDDVKIQDDPVRKGLSYDFRMSDGRQIFTIPDKAVVCTAKTDKLPITMDELQRFSSPNANEFTIFYFRENAVIFFFSAPAAGFFDYP